MILNFLSKRKVRLNLEIYKSFCVRVRFAPSPTGDMHLGGIRTALFNYLFAKQHKGTFIVRIEDTDQKRHVDQSTQKIFKTLNQLGINPDQSMLNPNPKYQPYVQSQRKKLYQFYIDKLLQDKKAFHCFCDNDTHTKQKNQQKQDNGYNGKCLRLSQQQVKQKIGKGQPYAIRIKSGFRQLISNTFHDEVYGQIKTNRFDDFVILKRDGFPTFHFANVIDDAQMEVTHVIRGQQWLTNTPKHIYIYKILGLDHPKFVHLPLLLSSDGKKLSKRSKFSSFNWVLQQGYLPQAIINFSALLGWASKVSKSQFYTIEDLIKEFNIEGISKNPVRVNQKKLNHFNKLHLKSILQKNNPEAQQYLVSVIQKQIEGSKYFCQKYKIAAKNMIISRIVNFSEIKLFSYIFYGADFSSAESQKDLSQFFGKDSKIQFEKLQKAGNQYSLQYLPYHLKENSLKIRINHQKSVTLAKTNQIIQKLYDIFVQASFSQKYVESVAKSIVNLSLEDKILSEVTSKQIYHILRFILIGCKNGPDTIQLIQLFGLDYALKSIQNFRNAVRNIQNKH